MAAQRRPWPLCAAVLPRVWGATPALREPHDFTRTVSLLHDEKFQTFQSIEQLGGWDFEASVAPHYP